MNLVIIGSSNGRPLHTCWLANEQDIPTPEVGTEVLSAPEGISDLDLITNHVYSGGEWVRRPDGIGQTFVLVDGVWSDPRPLDELKTAKNNEINAARLAANYGTFEFGGKTISASALSRSDIEGVNGIVSLTGDLPPGFPGAWKCLDNSYVQIPDKAAWVAFYSAMVAQGTANFTHAQNLKAALSAATTAAEVEAIVW